ncbi:MAG: hypothetical protein ACRCZZ_08575 [Phocaeicola sp.]
MKIAYSNSLPSLTDGFQEYLSQNLGQLTTSFLTAQGNLEYDKQIQALQKKSRG